MMEFFNAEHKIPLWKNFHFWTIILISFILIFLYLTWPWRDGNFNPRIWQWMNWTAPLYRLAVFEIQYRIIGILFLVPIIYANIAFNWRGSLIYFLLVLIYLTPLIIRIWNDYNSLLFNFVFLLLPILILTAIKIELELRRKDKEIYIKKEQEYKMYLAKIIETQEKERRRLAEELHDGSVQTLLAVASYAESIELSDYNLAEVKIKSAWIKENIHKTVEELRKMSVNLRPGILDNMGLIPALKWLTAQSNGMGNLRVHLNIHNFKQDLQPEVEVNIFRIIQEALHNVKKHSKANDAYIEIDDNTKFLLITIRDNGQGFVAPNKLESLVIKGKLGLVGIQERIKSLGGTLKISSAPNEGTLLVIKIPIQLFNSPQLVPLDNGISPTSIQNL
jgi:signal transduction histidine kinase